MLPNESSTVENPVLPTIMVPISSIEVGTRARVDYGDLTELQESIRKVLEIAPETGGLIHPILIDADNRLVAGGRRFASYRELGLESIPARILRTSDDWRLAEIELEENIKRKDMSWQEEALALHEIWTLKKKAGFEIGENWGVREASRLLGISTGQVSYVFRIASELRKGDAEIRAQDSLPEAIRVLLKRKEAEANTYKAALGAVKPTAPVSDELADLLGDQPAAPPPRILLPVIVLPHLDVVNTKNLGLIIVEDITFIKDAIALASNPEILALILIPSRWSRFYETVEVLDSLVGSVPPFIADKAPLIFEDIEVTQGTESAVFKVNTRPIHVVRVKGFTAATSQIRSTFMFDGRADRILYGREALPGQFWQHIAPAIGKRDVLVVGAETTSAIEYFRRFGHQVFVQSEDPTVLTTIRDRFQK